MKTARTRIVAAIAIVAAIVAARAVWFSPRPLAVTAAAVERGPVEALVTNSEAGTVRSRAQARVGVDVTGRVSAILRREGASVRAGEVLLTLDPTVLRDRLAAAERELQALDASHEAAHADVRLAQQTYDRTSELRQRGVVAEESWDQARRGLASAEAELRAAQARRSAAESTVRALRSELAHLAVRAPFAGMVAHRLVEVGEPVIPGQPVMEITDVDHLYVSAPIDERDAGRLVPGLPARVTVDTYPGVVWPGRLTRIAPVVEEAREQNRTLEVEVDLPLVPGRPRPRPGMTADVEIVLERRAGVLRIPAAALLDTAHVYALEGGRARARRVWPGLKSWQWVEIDSGLAAGQRVITSLDRAGLADGSAVRLEAEARPAGSRP